jgi:hypothetical protein
VVTGAVPADALQASAMLVVPSQRASPVTLAVAGVGSGGPPFDATPIDRPALVRLEPSLYDAVALRMCLPVATLAEFQVTENGGASSVPIGDPSTRNVSRSMASPPEAVAFAAPRRSDPLRRGAQVRCAWARTRTSPLSPPSGRLARVDLDFGPVASGGLGAIQRRIRTRDPG